MSEFNYIKETDTEGILRYKGRKCGSYKINGQNVEVDISTATGKAAWLAEFKEDSNAISKFFGLDVKPEPTPEPEIEPTPEPEIETEDDVLVEWRNMLLDKAEANGNIAAIKNDGNGVIYKGPATQDNIDAVLEYDDIVEVLNDPARD